MFPVAQYICQREQKLLNEREPLAAVFVILNHLLARMVARIPDRKRRRIGRRLAGKGPGTMDKKLYIHIGGPKTGTTALQIFLAQNRQALERQGFCYPGNEDAHWGICTNLQEHTLKRDTGPPPHVRPKVHC